jgi:hypothetical protein
MFVVLFSKCKNTVRKSINRRARTREAVERSVLQIKKCYRGQKSIASDFSFRDTSQHILRLEKQKKRPKLINS